MSHSDPAAQAVGKVTEALETIERARGHLYSFHQLTGRADRQLDAAVAQLHEAGQADLAERINRELVGRNVLPGRWSFQVVEDYDDGYYRCFQDIERLVRSRLTDGLRQVYERRAEGALAHVRPPGSYRFSRRIEGVNRWTASCSAPPGIWVRG